MSHSLIEKVLGSTNAEPLSAASKTVRSFIVQAKRANSHAIELGPSATLAAGKGYELCKPTADQPLPEREFTAAGGNCIELANWYLLGTKNEGINLIIEEY